MFINYTPATGIQISRSRHHGAYYGELCDVALAVTYNHELCCCDLDGAKAVLDDDSYWQGHRVTADALEVIRAAIQTHDNPDPGSQMLCASSAPDA